LAVPEDANFPSLAVYPPVESRCILELRTPADLETEGYISLKLPLNENMLGSVVRMSCVYDVEA
jgi:hypothetical protein